EVPTNLTLGARKSPTPCPPVAMELAGRSVETTTERRNNGAHTVASTLHRGLGEMPALGGCLDDRSAPVDAPRLEGSSGDSEAHRHTNARGHRYCPCVLVDVLHEQRCLWARGI